MGHAISLRVHYFELLLLLLVGEQSHGHQFLEEPEVSLLQVLLLLISVNSVEHADEEPFQAVVHFHSVLPPLRWNLVSLFDCRGLTHSLYLFLLHVEG